MAERAKLAFQMIAGKCDIIIDTTQALEDCVQIFLEVFCRLHCTHIMRANRPSSSVFVSQVPGEAWARR